MNNKAKSASSAVVRKALIITFIAALLSPNLSSAQSIEQIRWKSEEQVRRILGEPQSTTGPVGTHANYTIWEYPEFKVAFANKRAFHLFHKDSLKKLSINENRS